MLYKDNGYVNKLLASDNRDLFNDIECWVKEENNYNLYIFASIVQNQDELKILWTNLTNAIAVYFQSELEKDIERWNIYILFVVKEKISMEIKYEIEQDKYSSRKIVIDNVQEINIKELIESKLFSFYLPKSEKEDLKNTDMDMNLKDILYTENRRIYNIIENFPNDKPVNQLIKYLGW